jgi:hypothetical protein
MGVWVCGCAQYLKQLESVYGVQYLLVYGCTVPEIDRISEIPSFDDTHRGSDAEVDDERAYNTHEPL